MRITVITMGYWKVEVVDSVGEYLRGMTESELQWSFFQSKQANTTVLS